MPDVRKLSGNLYFVRGEGRGRFPSSNGILLTGKETVLIDAGIGAALIREIDRLHRIDVLIITHSHPDHIRYWRLLEDRHVLLPKETPDVAYDLQLLGERFTGSVRNGAHWAGFVSRAFGVSALREPDGRYSDAQVLDFGGVELLAIHAPGHVDDHYCFLERTTGTLISTDIDLTPFGPWYGNVESDIEVFAKSVRMVMALPYRRVVSSHREPVEGDAKAYFEAFLDGFERHKRAILNLCRRPITLDEIAAASPFYGNGLRDKVIQGIFERNMARKNLTLLLREGLVEETDGRYRSTA